jgi:hypothetical protein
MVYLCRYQEHSLCEELAPEPIKEVKFEIQRACQSNQYVDFALDLKAYWTDNNYILSLESTPKSLKPRDLQQLCNKPSCFYWRQAAQPGGQCPSRIVAAIFKECFRCYNKEPNITDGHFFASLIRIASDGPSTISGILQAQREISKQAGSLLDNIGSGEVVRNRSGPWLDPKRFNLLPLSQSIIVIIEELAPVGVAWQDGDGIYLLDGMAQIQSVLLVRAGDESDLSAPITFEDLQSTASSDNTDTIRVSLSTAVKFIASVLQRQKEGSFSGPRDPYSSSPSHLEGLHRIHYSDDTVSRALLDESENYSHEIRNAIRRINAKRPGENIQGVRAFPIP